MALTSDGVAKVANLARLHLSAAEEAQFTDKLNTILGMIDVLAQADTSAVTPLAHPLEATQPLRADEVSERNQREAYQAIAPAVEAGLYLVPKVIE